jgi:hypothetical protein
MAQTFPTFSAMEKMSAVNGLLLSLLDKRAHPLENKSLNLAHALTSNEEDECVHECANMIPDVPDILRSNGGFIGKNETFKQVLERDWTLVHDVLKTTHIELAAHVRRMLAAPACHAQARQLSCNITYNASELHSNTIWQPQPQPLRITVGRAFKQPHPAIPMFDVDVNRMQATRHRWRKQTAVNARFFGTLAAKAYSTMDGRAHTPSPIVRHGHPSDRSVGTSQLCMLALAHVSLGAHPGIMPRHASHQPKPAPNHPTSGT